MATSRRQQQQQILALAQRQQPIVGRAFLEGIKEIKSKVKLAELQRLIEARRYRDAVDVVSEELVRVGMFALADKLKHAFELGGTLAASFADAAGVKVRWNVVNPTTARLLNNYVTTLVRQVTLDTKKTLGAIISDAINRGDNPLTTARAIKESIGLTSAQARFIENYRRELSAPVPSRAALERLLRDRRFDNSILAAIRDKKPLSAEQIERFVGRYQSRFIAYRGRTIARTESLRMVNVGNREMFRQAVEEGQVEAGQVRRYWIYTHDEKTRESHIAIPEMNPQGVGIDEPFKSPEGDILYPCDPAAPPSMTINCRCTVFTEIVPKV